MVIHNTNITGRWLVVTEAGQLWSTRANVRQWITPFPAANLSLKAATAARVSGHVFPLPSTAITLSSAPTNALGKTPTTSVFNAKMEVRYAILSLDGSANGSISLR